MRKNTPTTDMTIMRMDLQNLDAKYRTSMEKNTVTKEQMMAHSAVLDCLEILDETVEKLGVKYG